MQIPAESVVKSWNSNLVKKIASLEDSHTFLSFTLQNMYVVNFPTAIRLQKFCGHFSLFLEVKNDLIQ